MRQRAILLGALAAVAISACTSDTSQTSSQEEPDAMVVELCGVLEAAIAGDVELARSRFDHGPLHTLAANVSSFERGVAARLLEAKEAVESDLAGLTPAEATLVANLQELVAATAEALAATRSPSPVPCNPENP